MCLLRISPQQTATDAACTVHGEKSMLLIRHAPDLLRHQQPDPVEGGVVFGRCCVTELQGGLHGQYRVTAPQQIPYSSQLRIGITRGSGSWKSRRPYLTLVTMRRCAAV